MTVLLLALLLAACDINVAPTATPAAAPTSVPSATAVPVAPIATDTAVAPTATPAPAATNTPAPAATDTTVPAPSATPVAAQPSATTEARQSGSTLPASPEPAVSRAIKDCSADDLVPISQSSLGDAYFPQLGNGGYDALSYALDLTVDMDAGTISGTTTMVARAVDDQDSFNLDFNGLDIAAISVNGAAASYSRANGELTIRPPVGLKAGAEFTSVVSYSGTPAPEAEGGAPLAAGWNKYDGGVWVFNEPASAHTWYPVNDHPCDKATYTIHVNVPKPWTVAANGTLTGVDDAGDSSTFNWSLRDPAPSYLITVDIEKFVRQDLTGPNGLPLRNYFPAKDATRLEETFARQGEMIDLFNQKFGPYPFEAYGAMVTGTELGFAGEAETLSVFSSNVGMGGNSDEVIAHELSHQWFGDSVSLKTWKDLWLKEGFATFAQWVWLEHDRGAGAVEPRIRSTYQTLKADNPPPPAEPPQDNMYNAGVYLRGGLTLQAVRHRIGDDTTFFRILQTWTSRYRYGNATTQDFINLANEVSGQDLTDLFDTWLHSPELPPLSDLVG